MKREVSEVLWYVTSSTWVGDSSYILGRTFLKILLLSNIYKLPTLQFHLDRPTGISNSMKTSKRRDMKVDVGKFSDTEPITWRNIPFNGLFFPFILSWPKSLFGFFYTMAVVVLSHLLISFETIWLDCMVILAYQHAFKKVIKTGEFLWSHLILKMEENTQFLEYCA